MANIVLARDPAAKRLIGCPQEALLCAKAKRQQQMFSVVKAKRQQQMFSVAKAKRQQQMFSVAKAKRQLKAPSRNGNQSLALSNSPTLMGPLQ